MKKRLLSLLLAMLMVVSILPVTANADLSVGHLIDVRFQVLYLDSGLKLGYNLGPSEKTTFVCQYTTKHSATAASSHIISIRDIQAAAVRMQMNTGCVFVGWTKTCSADPTIWSTEKEGTTICNKGTTIYLVAREKPFVLNFDANGGTGAPAAQIWIGSPTISSHDFQISSVQPHRTGFTFEGWSTGKYNDVAELSAGEIINVRGTTKLYAVWKRAGGFEISENAFRFLNSGSVFCAPNYSSLPEIVKRNYCYDLSPADSIRLLKNIPIYDMYTRAVVGTGAKLPWGGSCFGMSAVAVLAFCGVLNPSNYGYSSIRKMEITQNWLGSLDVGKVESLINYYYLMQHIGHIAEAIDDYSANDESENLKNIIKKMSLLDGKPCVLALSFSDGGKHAVVAYDMRYDDEDQAYRVKIYDCSLSHLGSFVLTITKSGNSYTKSCQEWESYWNAANAHGIFIRNVLTADDFRQMPFLLQSMDDSDSPAEYSMTTSFDSFTVSDGTASVTVRDGAVDAENALGLVFYDNESEPGFTPSYRTSLPALTSGTYTVEPLTDTDGEQPDEYTIQFRYDDASAGFFHNLVSAAPVTVRLGAGGALMTQSEAVAAQTLTSAYNGSRIAADGVTVSGQTTGFTASMQDGSVSVASQTAAEIDLTLSSGLKEQTKTLTLDENGVTLGTLESDERTCEIRRGEEALDTVHLGCAVAFDSCGGSTVATAAAAYGSRITEPEAPVRDGYLFHGWYTDPDCTKPWSFTSAVKEDMVLYAEWWVDPECWRTITFRADGVDDLVLQVRKDTRLTSADLPASDCMPGMTITWDAQQVADLLKAPVTKDVVISGTAVPCAILSIASAGYQDGTVTALVKNTGKAQTLTFIAAAYDADGRMTDCRTAPVTVEANAEASVSLPFPANPETIIRCYLTDSRSAPVCPRVELRSSET